MLWLLLLVFLNHGKPVCFLLDVSSAGEVAADCEYGGGDDGSEWGVEGEVKQREQGQDIFASASLDFWKEPGSGGRW